MSILTILSLILGAAALPAPAPEPFAELRALPLEARQSINPLRGNCTVATNKCIGTWPGSSSPWSFTCGALHIIAGPTILIPEDMCTVEGAPCTSWITITSANTDCGCKVTNSC
ncbi:hypothetical protein QBC44DRAFT_377399 [Cladorrhinum sp. PSN332]|nr:hypothetical protein QBC44DRAFT_377399 [Cladorrhinum sp. PSN332]